MKTDFDKNGFLGMEAENITQEILKKYKEFFNILFDINRFAHQILYSLEVNNKDSQQVITACLFGRFLITSQGAIILAKRGFDLDVLVILRVAFEVLVKMKKCCEDKNFISEYINSDEMDRLKFMKISHGYHGEFLSSLRKYATKEKERELREKIRNRNIQSFPSLKKLAKSVGLSEYYDTFYRIASQAVHTAPRPLEKFIEVNGKEDISKLVYNPDDKNVSFYLLTLAEFLLLAIDSVCTLFSLKKEKIKYLRGELKKIGSQLKD